MEQFLTTYKNDYPPKKSTIKKFFIKQEFIDPLKESYRLFLDINNPKATPPQEDGSEFMKKVKVNNPKIGKMYLGNDLDKKVITNEYIGYGKSEYQIIYCDVVRDAMMKELAEKNRPYLNNDIYIPLTTQKNSYRPPTDVNENCYKKSKKLIIPNNLGKDGYLHEILKVKTGDSEYMDGIGKLGLFCIENQIHGKLRR